MNTSILSSLRIMTVTLKIKHSALNQWCGTQTVSGALLSFTLSSPSSFHWARKSMRSRSTFTGDTFFVNGLHQRMNKHVRTVYHATNKIRTVLKATTALKDVRFKTQPTLEWVHPSRITEIAQNSTSRFLQNCLNYLRPKKITNSSSGQKTNGTKCYAPHSSSQFSSASLSNCQLCFSG